VIRFTPAGRVLKHLTNTIDSLNMISFLPRMGGTFLCCLFALTLFSQTAYIGPANGDWFTPANWSAGLPAPGNNALVTGGASVVIGSPLTVNFRIDNFGSIAVNATLTNTNTIANSGPFTVNGTGTLINQSTFQNFSTVTFVAPATFTNSAGATFSNSGPLVISTTLTNAGTFTNNGNLNNTGGSVQNTGSFENDQTLTTRTLQVTAPGSFLNQFGSTLNISGSGASFAANGPVTNNGAINNAGSMTLTNVFTNNVNVTNTGSLSVNPGAQLNNGGTVLNQGTFTNLATVTNNNQFYNEATADNFSAFANNNTLENRATGTFTVKPGASLDCGFGSQLKNFGTFFNNNNLTSVGTLTNTGSFTNSGTLLNNTGGAINSSGAFTNNGTLNSANTLTSDGTWTNGGTLNVNSGCIFNVNGPFTNTTTGRLNNLFEVHVNATSAFINNGNVTNTIRYYITGMLTNNAYFFNPGDVFIQPGGQLVNKQIVELAAGNLVNQGTVTNTSLLIVDDCSSLVNTGSVNNTGGTIQLRGIIFQRGTLTGNAVTNNGGYIHTDPTSNAPAVCKGGDFSANDLGEVKVYATSLISFTNFDSCSNIIYRGNGIARPLFHCSDIGVLQNINVMMRTRLGDSLTCIAPVSPVDALAPNFTNCPPNITVYTGGATAPATWTAPTAVDNCTASPTITSTSTPGTSFPVGITGVTYTAKDAFNNAQNCQFKVTVIQAAAGSCTNDVTPPVFTGCPANVTVHSNFSADQVSWTPPVATDGCFPLSLTATYEPGNFFPAGTTTVVYSAKDGNGNSSTCQFTITLIQNDLCITDNRKPVINNCPPNIFAFYSADINGAVARWTSPNIGDNCAIQSITSTFSSGSIFPSGSTTVTYTATDGTGNTATCSFVVTVAASDPCPGDVTGPTIANCLATINVNTTGTTAAVNWTAPTASDACGPVTLVSNYKPGDIFPLGATEVVYQASDKKGNTAVCVFTIIVNTSCSADATPPTINNCPANFTVNSTNGTNAAATWTVPTATDNCGLISLNASYLPGALFPVGQTIVIYTATDLKGNTATCQFTVSVVSGVFCTTNTSPLNNATGINPSSVTLTWNAAPNATTYDVYLGPTNPPTVKVGADLTVTSFTASNLLANTGYFWYVVPKNGTTSATGCSSGFWKFTTNTVSGCNRVTNNLVALYDFKEGSGSTVKDVSGVGAALDLQIADPGNVTRLPGGCGISVNQSTIIKSSALATKLKTAITASNSMSVEVWVKPANLTQTGPARIATYSANTTNRNFMLGQDGHDYVARMRTSTTDANGNPTVAAGNIAATQLQHVVYTWDASGYEKIFVNNAITYSGPRSGTLTNWSGDYYFALANEMTLDRSWLGEIYLVAVYSKALNASEVSQNYGSGPCCGSTTAGACKATAGTGWYKEVWNNISGVDIPSLTTNANYPDNPSSVSIYNAGSLGPVNIADNYGTRVRGFITPAQTGTYYFTVVGDDYTELYLSSNASPVSKTKIAWVYGWTTISELTKYPSQKSAAIMLNAGQDYYVELLQKEGSGGDNWGVYWQTPGSSTFTSIPVQYLSPIDPTCGNQPVSCAGNLITSNTSFEGGLDGYWFNGNVVTTSEAAKGGIKSARICDGAGSVGKTLPGSAGNIYTLSAYAETLNGPSCALLKTEFQNASYQALDYVQTTIASTGWQSYTASKAAPAGTAYIVPHVYKCTGGCVYVDDLCLTSTPAIPPFAPDPTKCYKLVNKASGRVIDVKGASLLNGAQVIQNTFNDGADEKFKFTDVGNGYYEVIAQHSGKVLDITGSSSSDNAYVQQWAYGNSDNQKFKFEALGSGYFKITAKNSGKSLRPESSPGTDGTRLVQKTFNNSDDAFKWQILEVACPSTNCNLNTLLVVGNLNLSNGDVAVKNRLTGLGLNVTVIKDNVVNASSASGKGLIVVSSSSYSSSIGNHLTQVAVPLICYEAWLFDNLKMTGDEENDDFGLLTDKKIKILQPGHPIAAGYSGTVQVFSSNTSETWGKPGPGAVGIASVPNYTKQKAIFAYETGTEMVGINAPARRVGFFFRDNNPTSLTSDGWKLFDNAVKWATGCSNLNSLQGGGHDRSEDLDPGAQEQSVQQATRPDFQSVALYPNPASGQVNLVLKPFEGQDVKVALINQMGQVVRIIPAHAEADPLPIDLTGLAKGCYFVSVVGTEGQVTLRLVVTE
jgi:hypothetical protein